MSVVYAQTLKNTRMTSIITALDAQTSFAQLAIMTSGFAAVLSTITLQKPSFVMSAGVITLQGVPLSQASATGTGTAATAQLQDSAGTWWVELTVGTTATDIIIGSTSIVVGETVTVTAGTITHS